MVELHIHNNLGFKTFEGLAYFQIVKCYGFDVRNSDALPRFDPREQAVIFELINMEAITDKVMYLLQVEDFIQPVHQQRLAVNSFDFNLSRCRRLSRGYRPIQRLHGTCGIFQQAYHVAARDAKRAVTGVFDFFKAPHSITTYIACLTSGQERTSCTAAPRKRLNIESTSLSFFRSPCLNSSR